MRPRAKSSVDALRLLQLHDRDREALVSGLRQKIAVGLEQT